MKILTYPEPLLRQESKPVENFDGDLRNLVKNMLETMYENKGLGLAAPQVGVLKRLVVVDVGQLEDNPEPLVLVNPEIVSTKGTITWEEGCLSVPGVREKVKRNEYVKVRYKDIEGNDNELEAHELLAVAIQHELDHLDGILFIDRLSPARKKLVKKMLERAVSAT